MNLKLLLAIILSFLPISEIRGGLPLGIIYGNETGTPIWIIFFLLITVNILAIFFVFLLLDCLNKLFFKMKWYKKLFERYIQGLQKKIDKFEAQYSSLGFLALTLFVAVPIPGTGAWTGSLIAWTLGLNRKKSILSIGLGVIIAGVLMLLGTLGFLSLFF